MRVCPKQAVWTRPTFRGQAPNNISEWQCKQIGGESSSKYKAATGSEQAWYFGAWPGEVANQNSWAVHSALWRPAVGVHCQRAGRPRQLQQLHKGLRSILLQQKASAIQSSDQADFVWPVGPAVVRAESGLDRLVRPVQLVQGVLHYFQLRGLASRQVDGLHQKHLRRGFQQGAWQNNPWVLVSVLSWTDADVRCNQVERSDYCQTIPQEAWACLEDRSSPANLNWGRKCAERGLWKSWKDFNKNKTRKSKLVNTSKP